MQDTDNATFGGLDNEDRATIEDQLNECNDGGDDKESQPSSDGTDEQDLSPEMNSALTRLASRLLCDACQNLCRCEAKVIMYESGEWETRDLPYHPSLSSLGESVRAGCPFCKEIADSFEERLDTDFKVRDIVTDSWSISCHLRSINMTLLFVFSFYDSSGQGVNNEVSATISKKFYRAELLRPGPEYLEYAHEATKRIHVPNIALAKYWVDQCSNQCHHRNEPESKFLPSRLIEIDISGDTSPNMVAKICETEDFSADASYLSLSHCWGGNTIFTLTRGNLEALRQDIPIQQLPILFRDAIYMTSQLGFKYIWIDCLCILQDCKDDWEYEANRMGDVYQYAACNIAASGYKDGKTSLFKERTAISFLNYPLCMDLTQVADNEGTDYFAIKGVYVRTDRWEFRNAVTKGPLNSRGWVAQERALSPGILHFTPKQMWWECQDHVFSEFCPYVDFHRDEDGGINTLHMNVTTGDRNPEFQRSWNKFVAFYAGTDLTFWSDRFPALTGMARRFAAITEDNLIAGFWESNLISSLAWRVSDENLAKKIPHEQLAPSWSWACLCVPHERAHTSNRDTRSFSVVRRVLSDDPGFRSDLQYKSLRKSAVRGLEVTGPLRRLPVEAKKLGALLEGMYHELMVLVYYDMADKSFFSATDLADEAWHWLWEEPTHMLPLIQNETVDFWNTCLLLSRVTGSEHQNTFRRVGVVEIRGQRDTCYKVFGMDDGNEGPKPSTVFEDCGTHDLILI